MVKNKWRLQLPKVNIKPLSTNKAWKGRRFKSPNYKAFESELIYKLPNIDLPKPPFELTLDFGFSKPSKNDDRLLAKKI